MGHALASIVRRLEAFARLAENSLLVAILTGIIVLASGQILLRNVFNTGFVWSDELLRLMVLWLTMVGAMTASRDNKHIKIDVLSRILPAKLQLLSQALTALFASLICVIITWHAFRFVAGSREFGETLLENLPAWYFQAILPFGFGLIAFRYSILSIRTIIALFEQKTPT